MAVATAAERISALSLFFNWRAKLESTIGTKNWLKDIPKAALNTKIINKDIKIKGILIMKTDISMDRTCRLGHARRIPTLKMIHAKIVRNGYANKPIEPAATRLAHNPVNAVIIAHEEKDEGFFLL
jgi:hypothetical protein